MSKILIAEDDKFFLAFYKNKLVQAGHEVITAEDGVYAIQEIEKSVPDLLILDLVMPNKDGFEVLAYLKNNQKTKDLPIIVFSALTQADDIAKAKSLGVKEYYDKSTTEFELLKSKIDSLLNK